MADRIGNRLILTVCGLGGAIGMGLFVANFGAEPQYLSDILLPSLFIGVAAGTGFSQLVGAAMRVCPHQYAMGGAGHTTAFQMAIAPASPSPSPSSDARRRPGTCGLREL